MALAAAVKAMPSCAAVRAWTPQQKCYRNLMRSLRDAYYAERSTLFWARHRVRIEFYKFSTADVTAEVQQLVGVGNEIAAFIGEHMKTSVDRIVSHNETMLKLSVREAKRFREEFMRKEHQHESWCKQKIKTILQRRPNPPYPFC